MVKMGGPGKQNPNILANIPEPGMNPSCANGAIWTNLTDEELSSCFPSGIYTIPHSGYKRCNLIKSVGNDQLIAPGIWTPITFDDEIYDVGNIHDKIINNERIYVTPGWYDIAHQIDWQSKKDTSYQGRIMMNDIDIVPNLSICLFSPKDDIDFCVGRGNKAYFDTNCYITLEGLNGASVNRYVRAEKTSLSVTRIF